VSDGLIHARGRFAAVCWPKEGHKYGTLSMSLEEVTCIDCRDVVIAFTEHREGLGIQTNSKVLEDERTNTR
jgi:hypothetical protein